MPLALLALAIGAFGIGTTEFVIMGLLPEVAGELCRAVERALRAGVAAEKIAVDPGVGFGKLAEHSAALVAASKYLMRETGCPVVIGASRTISRTRSIGSA